MKTPSSNYSNWNVGATPPGTTRWSARIAQRLSLRTVPSGQTGRRSLIKRGPYPLLTRKQGGKTLSVRLTDPALVPLYRQQIQALRQFETVVDQLVGVGEELSDLAVAEVVQKKTHDRTGTKRRSASPGSRAGQPPES